MKLYLSVLITFFLIIEPASSQYVWTQKNSMTTSRYIGCGFTIGSKSYTGTGYNSNAVAMSDWWEYDSATDNWTQKASMPSARAAASAFVINGMGYVGLGATSSMFLTDLYEYNPISNTWASKASLPAAGRFGTASFAIGNIGYICCGNLGSASGPYSNELFAYDAVTNTWSSKATFPGTERYGCRGAALNNTGFITGGINGTGTTTSLFFDDLWEYNPNTDSWSQKPNIPGLGRQYPSTFVIDGKFIVGTGVHWTGFLSDFYAFDPLANSWSNLPSLPAIEARWSAVGFSNGSAGYIVSGNQSFNNPIVITNDLWKLELSTSLHPSGVNSNQQFNVYPTLASNHITLSLTSADQNDYRLILTNSSGQVCLNMPINIGETVMSTTGLSQGIYLAFVTDNNNRKVAAEKFIIRHN